MYIYTYANMRICEYANGPVYDTRAGYGIPDRGKVYDTRYGIPGTVSDPGQGGHVGPGCPARSSLF